MDFYQLEVPEKTTRAKSREAARIAMAATYERRKAASLQPDYNPGSTRGRGRPRKSS